MHVRRRALRPDCGGCGGGLWSDGERPVELVDLPAFGRPARLVWHKRRWRCPRRGCAVGTFTEQDSEIAPPRERLSTRAGRWATRQAGRGRALEEVAAELGCSWHPVNASVRCWGEALLAAEHLEDLRGRRAGTGRDPDVAARPLQGQGLGHQHRRRRFGPALGHSPRPHRASACPLAAETPPHLARRPPPSSSGSGRGPTGEPARSSMTPQPVPASPSPTCTCGATWDPDLGRQALSVVATESSVDAVG